MATNIGDDEFDEYDKPGAERSRQRRGDDDDDMGSDLERDLLEEDWLSSKKNPSDFSDEDLNDDLLQSDEEDQNASGHAEVLSLNATLDLGTSDHLHGQEGYTDDTFEAVEDEEGFSQDGAYGRDEYREEGMEYPADHQFDDYKDEVLDLEINEPLDDEFQVEGFQDEYREECEEDEGVPGNKDDSQFAEFEETKAHLNNPEAEGDQVADVKEESDEEDEDDEESGRLRFKTERKDVTVSSISEAASKRRNIPETLELSEQAKADLQEFEERERQRKQGRFGGQGRGGWRGRGGPRDRGRGGRQDFSPFGMGGFHRNGSDGRGRINEQRPPLMQMNLRMQQHMRMSPALQHHQHHSRLPGSRGAGGPELFPDPGAPITQQPLQLLMPQLPHRSPGLRSQHDNHGPHLMNSPPRHAHPNQQHPKNIHINPHFRGPASAPAPVPSMPPAQNPPRPGIAQQRILGALDFQPHLPGNFCPPPRPLPPQEQWRGPPPPHQDQERFFNEPRFPGQHMFEPPGPAPLMNNSVHPMSGQGPPNFPAPGVLAGPGFNPMGLGPGQGPQGGGGFQRDPPRPGLVTPHAGPPGLSGPRGFMGHRQSFSPQHQGPFSPQHLAFGMQQHCQPPLLDPPPSHPPLHQQHRLDMSHQILPLPQPPSQQHPHHSRDQHHIMQLSPPPFRQMQSGHRPGQHRQQGAQIRNNHPRPRMSSPPMQPLAPQRNSNLRELPIASSINNSRLQMPSGQAKTFSRPNLNIRAGQGARGGLMGRGGASAPRLDALKMEPCALELKKECPVAQPSAAEDLNEDEETREYRRKIEEQKRLREQILKRKELRRQQQAGERKKELMERISTQNPPGLLPTDPPTAPPPQPVPSLISNGTTQNPSAPVSRPNTKVRLLGSKPQAAGWSAPGNLLTPPLKGPTIPQNIQRQGPLMTAPTEGHVLAQPGVKRTVRQRTNCVEPPQVPQKVRVVKLKSEIEGDAASLQQPIGQSAAQQRLAPVRKVAMASGGLQNPQQAARGMANPTNRMVVRGRGRGGGRGMQMQQNFQRSSVCIEGLSASTTDKQLMNLLKSIGPVETFTMLPEQRKAIAKFIHPQHAASFQLSFHRHMIDLSHISVSVIDG